MDVLIPILGLLGVLALTAGTFVNVAAEFSLTALERSTVDNHLETVGDRRARRVKAAHSTLSFQLSGAQVGITITTLVTGYIAEPVVGQLLEPVFETLGMSDGAAGATSLIVALILATGLSMTFGELVPQMLAISRPLETARAVAGFQAAFSAAFRWLINGMNNSANWILLRIGIEPAEELRSARSPQELGSLVRASAQQGTLDPGTANLLDRSLRFGERTAAELMTPRMRVEALRLDQSVDDLAAAVARTGFSRFPVHGSDLDDIRGVVHVKQVFTVPRERRSATRLGSIARSVPTVPESLDGDALLDRLREGFQMAVVVDEYGGTAGIVTLEDLVEEIVGDVRDEHDRLEVSSVRPLGDRSWLISGLLRSDEVAEATGFEMPEGEYETVAGLVLSELGRIPSVGDHIEVDGWELTVMRMERRRIADLRLTASLEAAIRGESS